MKAMIMDRHHCRPLPFLTASCLLLPLLFCTTAGALVISGAISDAQGAPIPDVQVWLVQEKKLGEQRTDAQGAFRFEEVDSGGAQLVAWKEGWSFGGHSGLLFHDADVQVILYPPATIPLRIQSSSFSPLPGATVRAMLINDSFVVPVEDLLSKGLPPLRSDDDGLITIHSVPVGGYVKLAVTHPDYASSKIAYLPVREKRQEIVLVPGVPVRGRVTHAGAGIGDARVSIYKVTTTGQEEFEQLRTDPEGYFSARLAEGQYEVAVRHASYAAPQPMVVQASFDEEPSIALELIAPRYISSRLVDESNRPVAGVPVVFRSGGVVYDETMSAQDGQFLLKIPTGEGVMTVNPPPGMMTEALPDIPVILGEETRVTVKPIRLKRLPALEGAVVDEEGNPVERVLVTLEDRLFPRRTVTDQEGRFMLQLIEMPEDKQAMLVAEHPLRFLRKRFQIDLNRPRPAAVKLEPFSPDLSERELLEGDKEMERLLGKPAPPIEGDNWFNTQPLTLQDLRGKVVVLHLWAGFDTSIEGLRSIQELRALHELLREVEDVVFIGMHDASSTAEEVEDYLHQFNIAFPAARDADPFKTFTSYGLVYLPQTLLIDKKGVLRYFKTDGRLLEMIKALRREA